MILKVVTTPDADADLTDICDWYNTQSQNLDISFLESLRKLTLRIEESPYNFPIAYKAVRLAIVNNFPYKVLFIIDEVAQQAIIIALIHHARDPQHWKQRL